MQLLAVGDPLTGTLHLPASACGPVQLIGNQKHGPSGLALESRISDESPIQIKCGPRPRYCLPLTACIGPQNQGRQRS